MSHIRWWWRIYSLNNDINSKSSTRESHEIPAVVYSKDLLEYLQMLSPEISRSSQLVLMMA